jgi:diaminohydroxyphosphoribosylaminopyrimidine deaminase/5-amino-6-(5-phosphoribosylamino)uracil reductase
MAASSRDEAFMRAALALARRGLGTTAPNPAVAALVVDETREPPVVLGRGHTAPSGRPHAEDRALQQAGEAARGATIYITLEPCSRRSSRFYGPSCTDLILSHGLARVVIAARDASPFAAGEGTARLRAAGLTVTEGVLEKEAAALNAGHALRVQKNRPFIRIKLAETADGFAATPDRRPLAITGEPARAYVHRLRADCDAIITGIGTVLADDPMLDVRLPGMAGLSPLRVVLDTKGRIRPGLRMLADAARVPVLIATAAPETVLATLGLLPGVEVMALPADRAGGLDLPALLGALAARGITRAMVEAGPTLADAFAGSGLCDEFVRLTGPDTAGQGLVAIGQGLAGWLRYADLDEERPLVQDRARVYANRRAHHEGQMMFTGIVTDIGEIIAAEGEGKLRRFRIGASFDPATIAIGASIACSGICLTVIAKGENDGKSEGDGKRVRWFEVETAAETLRLTAAKDWQVGTRLNLERAMRMGDELGGHLVTGHVDALAEIVNREEMTPDEANWGATARFTLRAPAPLHRFIAAKGSVTLDGVSLTVNSVEDDLFSVLLIPHTLKVTTFGTRQAGDNVHLEVDMMARYAARLADTMK